MPVWSETNTVLALIASLAGFFYFARHKTYLANSKLLLPSVLAFLFATLSLIGAAILPDSSKSIFRVIEHWALAAAAVALAWQMLSVRVFTKP